jgi:Flp pilus assembly protein TadD
VGSNRTRKHPGPGRGLVAVFLLSAIVAHPVAAADICAQVVSLQGVVEIQRSGQAGWQRIERLDTRLCEGDRLRVGPLGRAALLVGPSALVRVDQNTVMGLRITTEETVVEFDSGAIYSISRFPRRYRINNPFVNANVEGTEFLVSAAGSEAEVAVYEGRVATQDLVGTGGAKTVLQGGQMARFARGNPATVQALINPSDAVQWALHYPALDSGTDRAAQLLRVGRVEEAERELGAAGARADALALRAIIRLTKNDKPGAIQLAQQAVAADPKSGRAVLAQSYTKQAEFKLEEALAAANHAVALEPANSTARARQAELLLSMGRLAEAETAATAAVNANPTDSRARTILGFAQLARLNTARAREQLQQALVADPADPLPRLGLGLADIKDGKLAEGREQIEVAVALDPQNAMLRSYLGKAYADEDRDNLAEPQFARSKELDPRDPTPWYYNAVRLQGVNQPGRALEELQGSVARNDNRAVYRSRLLLDQDQAARSASLARIYSELGFNELALSEGMRSLNTDPRNFAAHRFLAEAYEPIPRYEVARVSELLQSQMLQPAAAAVLAPRLGEVKSPIPQGSGPQTASFHELTPLFTRDGLLFSGGAVAGGQQTRGDEALFAYRSGSRTVQFGQFYFETDGYRENADLRQRSYSVFYQDDISYSTSWQFEGRTTEINSGDIKLQFDPSTFSPNERRTTENDTYRLGLRHSSSPGSTWLASFIKTDRSDALTQKLTFPGVRVDLANQVAVRLQQTEVQYLGAGRRADVIAGGGTARQHDDNATVTVVSVGPLPPFPPTRTASASNARHDNLYAYGLWRGPWGSTLTTAVAFDDFDDDVRFSQQRWSPKLGIVAPLGSGTTLRAAAFRSVKRPLAANQTLEPTQVAGFNQLFDDLNESRAKRLGAAIDHRFSARLFTGVEVTRRQLEVPTLAANNTLARFDNWDERLHRAYVSWLVRPSLSASAEYVYDFRYRDLPPSTGDVFPIKSVTRQIPLGLTYHHPAGPFASVRSSHVSQDLRFRTPGTGVETTGESDFWVTDASIGTRLPRRLGTVSLDLLNVFDEHFQYQDTDFFGTPRVPLFQPRRLILLRARITL